jgi:hypothetical protein
MVKVSRSFSKKVQLAPFEPINVFCGVEQEAELGDDMTFISELLDRFCRTEVEKTMAEISRIKEKIVNKVAIAKEKKEKSIEDSLQDDMRYAEGNVE